MSLPYSQDPEVERSLQHSVRDGVYQSFMSGSGETYLTAYALFLKATTAQIALLATLPLLLGSFAQLFSAWYGKRTGKRKAIIMSGVIFQALVWLPMIWLPYFFPAHAITILLVCVVLFYAAGQFSNPVWSSLMGDLVPEDKRGRFFANRTALMNLASFIALIIAGGILYYFEASAHTRLGFTIIFSLAAAVRLLSAYHISHMIEPAQPVSAPRMPPSSMLNLLRRIRQSSFARFSLFFALMNFAVGIAAPFFTVYMLSGLGFSYLEFMGTMAAAVIMQFLVLGTWGRISDAFGNRIILIVTGIIISILPALWLFSINYWYIIGIQLLSGVAWAGFSLSASNFVYDAVAPDKRGMYVAVNSILSNTGLFLGALLGGYLGLILSQQVTLFGVILTLPNTLLWVFLISTLVRITMAAIFIPYLREVRRVRPLPTRNLMLRVNQFTTLSDLMFNLFALGQRKPAASKEGLKVPAARHI